MSSNNNNTNNIENTNNTSSTNTIVDANKNESEEKIPKLYYNRDIPR